MVEEPSTSHHSSVITKNEIATVVAILRQLQPADLKEHPELIHEGTRLFERTIKTKLFGDDSVVDFLKQQSEYRFLLKRLERVQEEVERNHAALVQQASSAAINTIRETKTSEVNVIGVTALSTQAGLLTLLESLSVNPQLYQDYKLLEPSQPQTVAAQDQEQHDGVKEASTMLPSTTTVSSEKKKNKTKNSKERAVTSDSISVDHYSNGSAFRAGGIGRSRGRRAAFNLNRIEGMYDDCVAEEEGGDGLLEGNTQEGGKTLRRKGKIYFVPRAQAGGGSAGAGDGATLNLEKTSSSTSDNSDGNGSSTSVGAGSSSVSSNHEPSLIPGLGMLSYVQDDEDGALRAVALRTIVDVSGALTNLVGVTVQDDGSGTVFSHPVTYVIGHRRQRWALLGGEIQGLNGETAISVRLYLPEEKAAPGTEGAPVIDSDNVCGESTSAPVSAVTATAATSPLSMPEVIRGYVVPPRGSFRHHCNVCKQPYTQMHSFYHQLCPRCGDFNLQKRMQTADLTGYVCVVTGGRVRIGYQICLKLLRAGATVVATSRWPHDTVLRFAQESDFSRWQSRLSVDELELSDIEGVERYCAYLIGRYPRLHVLINNAAQTLTRPPGWRGRMDKVDGQALASLQSQRDVDIDGLQQVLMSPWNQTQTLGRQLIKEAVDPVSKPHDNSSPNHNPNPGCADPVISVADPVVVAVDGRSGTGVSIGSLDESGQPLDKSGMNSWSRRLAQVSTSEMVQTMAVNAVAPFVLCSRLQPVLAPSVLPATGAKGQGQANNEVYSHIVNVTALEGKFNVGKKSGGHPHTNMAKAALNMMTLTGARDYARTGILMNSVDTGWVTDMAPGGVGASSAMHETFIGPPLDDEDGASRVLDPVFSHVLGHGSETHCGHFYKDYLRASW